MSNRKAITFNEHCKIVFNEFNLKFLKFLTINRSKEFADYVDLESDLKDKVYFTDFYSSWQRGTNENTNGLIKEFFTKKFDFSTITQKEVDIVENYLNNRQESASNIRLL